MTGISGTSQTEKKYYYYQCVANRREKTCNKKLVQKDYIENLVITKAREFLTPENIDKIAAEVVALCEREYNNDDLKRLQKLMKENEKATESLFKVLESGQIVDVIAERIAQKKKEHDALEQQIRLESVQHPMPTIRDIKFFLNQLRKGDINDPKYQQGFVDTFINKIYLYDDKMTVLCNAQDSHFNVDLDKISLSGVGLVEHRGVEPLTVVCK